MATNQTTTITRRQAFTATATGAAALAIGTSPASADCQDAELMELGRQWQEASRRYWALCQASDWHQPDAEERVAEASEERTATERRIVAIPAATAAGIMVKAAIIADNDLPADPDGPLDEQAAASIHRDLCAMGTLSADVYRAKRQEVRS